jgi:hypothetical protein
VSVREAEGAARVASEATRYLEAIDLARSPGRMSAAVSALTDRNTSSASHGRPDDQQVPKANSAALALFVGPYRSGDGFRASVRGHILGLADPDSPDRLAPTPRDLVAAALASDVAWFARQFLRDRARDDYVSVSVRTSTSEGLPSWCSFDVTVDVSEQAAPLGTMLLTALEERFAAAASKSPRIVVRSA